MDMTPQNNLIRDASPLTAPVIPGMQSLGCQVDEKTPPGLLFCPVFWLEFVQILAHSAVLDPEKKQV